MRITLRVKMIISFLLILVVSCVVTFFGAVTISKAPILEEVKAGQFSYADNLLTLENQTSLTTQQILDVNVNSIYNTRLMDTYDQEVLDGEMIARLNSGEKIFVVSRLFASPSTLIKLGDEIVKISIRKQDVFEVFRFRIALVISSILILSCIILALASTRMLKPILKLTDATQRVAKGDFNVNVEIDSNDEIGILIKNFNRMTKELGTMEYLQKDFIRNVSHEFKTPLASIQGFAKLLQEENLPAKERAEFSAIILEESERLSKLSSNILRLSKLEHQTELTEKKEFRLDEQIRSVIVLLEPHWGMKKIDLEVQLDRIDYMGDEELLQQVWINLLENAIKFSNPGGSISISAHQTEQGVGIEIADQGIGMAEETAERIFDRFYQGSTSHSEEGSGLGLSIVKRILDLSHGEIHVKSTLNHGTAFLVKLPL